MEKNVLIVNIGCALEVANAFNKALSSFLAPEFSVFLFPPFPKPQNKEAGFIPLIICREKKEIEKKGFHIPDVFVFEQNMEKGGGSPRKTSFYFWDLDAVKRRLSSLFNSKMDCFVKKEELQDWCAGAFRMQLGLDEYCHGVHTWDYIREPGIIKEQFEDFCNSAPFDVVLSLLNNLFEDKIEKAQNIISAKTTKRGFGEDVIRYVDDLAPRGTQVRFLKPFGKLNALLVDDESIIDPWDQKFNILELIFNKAKRNDDKISGLIERLKEMKHLNYMIDFILLDLCIDDGLNEDPTGYRFLPVLRQFFPLTPIIVFSSFSDMGHIARAFKEGASWYLRKTNQEKLPRHIFSIFSKPQWTREWNGMEKGINFVEEKKVIEHIHKFLIVSSLKKIPGNTIRLKQSDEGASSSRTYIVTKGVSKAVVKIDTPNNARSEYDRYQRFIRPYLDNNAGRIYDAPIIADYHSAAIAYTFAGSTSDVETFRSRICDALPEPTPAKLKDIYDIIDDLFDNLISKLHSINVKAEDFRNDHQDYPNLFYLESDSFSGAYLAKMPNYNEIEVAEISTESGIVAETKKNDDKTRNANISTDSKSVAANTGDYIFVSRGIKKGKESAHLFDHDTMTSWNVVGDAVETAGMYNLSPFIFEIKGRVIDKISDGNTNKKKTKKEMEEEKELWNNLKTKFEDELKISREDKPVIIHGDLNTGNIMLEIRNGKTEKVWLIDFATTHRDCAVIDYTVLYYSVLCDLFSVLIEKSTPKDDSALIEDTWILEDTALKDFILYSAGLKQYIGGYFAPEWENTLNILRHISDKVPQKLKKVYQYGIAMSFVYGERNFRDEWCRDNAYELAKAIYDTMNPKNSNGKN